MTTTSTGARAAGLSTFAAFAGFAASIAMTGTAHADTLSDSHHSDRGDRNNTSCQIDKDDIQYSAADASGNATKWYDAQDHHSGRFQTEPVNGILVRVAQDGGRTADPGCTRTISLASYTADGPTWATSGTQRFVDFASATLGKGHPNTALLKVKLPVGADGKACFGQIDLYFDGTVFDGGKGPGHGPLPHYPDVHSPGDALIAAWNGGDATCSTTPPPTTPPPTTPPTTTPPTTKPPTNPPTSSTPSTPPTTKPSAPKPSTPTSSTPSTPHSSTPPATNTPSTPGSLAHTGASFVELSLIAVALFGAGGGVLVTSRRTAGRRQH